MHRYPGLQPRKMVIRQRIIRQKQTLLQVTVLVLIITKGKDKIGNVLLSTGHTRY
jgi:hypothetical protein